jgi:hypothetical protein
VRVRHGPLPCLGSLTGLVFSGYGALTPGGSLSGERVVSPLAQASSSSLMIFADLASRSFCSAARSSALSSLLGRFAEGDSFESVRELFPLGLVSSVPDGVFLFHNPSRSTAVRGLST